MKFSSAIGIFFELTGAVQMAIIPTIRALLKEPWVLFNPLALSRLFMSKLWIPFGDGVDQTFRAIKEGLITPNAYGAVLDIGAGHGHIAKYLDKTRVTKYIALEPNVHMHPILRSAANSEGFNEADGTLLILSCGAEDTAHIVSSLSDVHNHPGQVDTIISFLTLCSVPSPQTAISGLAGGVLASGGCFLFFEHVLSLREDVAWWQRFWTPIWTRAFDGCKLDRKTDVWIEEATCGAGVGEGEGESLWSKKDIWDGEEDQENLFRHRVGKMLKRDI